MYSAHPLPLWCAVMIVKSLSKARAWSNSSNNEYRRAGCSAYRSAVLNAGGKAWTPGCSSKP
eukprot:9981835-Heterocapsa_arctica.AAC.1